MELDYKSIAISKLVILSLLAGSLLLSLFDNGIVYHFNNIIVDYFPFENIPKHLDKYFIGNIVYLGIIIFFITSLTVVIFRLKGSQQIKDVNYATVEGIQRISGAFVFLLLYLIISYSSECKDSREILKFVFIISKIIYILIAYSIIDYLIIRRIRQNIANKFVGEKPSVIDDLIDGIEN